MKALTVRQPWGTAIIRWGKSPENRTRNIAGNHRGTIAIHAGLIEDDAAYDEPLIVQHLAEYDDSWLLQDHLETGVILGVADLTGVHEERLGCCRPWGQRSHDGSRIVHLELARPRALAVPVPCRGARGLWTLPAEVRDAVLEQLVVAL